MTARLTEDSLRTHGGLTHPLTEDSRLEVEGKGDRKWKGVRAEALHHGVQIETREATPIVAPSPVTTPDAMMILTAIEHLDFEPTCESRAGCDSAADYASAAQCPRCGRAWEPVAFACAEHWASADISPRRCPDCSHVAPWRNFWRIVQVLR